MKKMASLFLAGTMALSLAACGGSTASSSAAESTATPASTAESTEQTTADASDSDTIKIGVLTYMSSARSATMGFFQVGWEAAGEEINNAGGIGGKTAEVLGLAGYEVIITGIDEAGRQAVMSNLESKGVKAHFYFCDATNEEQVNETFAKIAQEFDSIDLLVNNVGGLGGRQRVSEMETSFMRKVMALNFDSLFFNTRAALPLLKKGTNPSIINFSTIAVTNGGGIGASVYAASKGAVQSYSRALAKDLAEFGIRVNMVSPGTIDTPFHAATDRKLVESWKDSILMKRLGDPREVADVIEFLASDKASFLTGEVIQINGGQAFI